VQTGNQLATLDPTALAADRPRLDGLGGGRAVAGAGTPQWRGAIRERSERTKVGSTPWRLRD
jgi:hypothetical protein